MYDNGVRKLEEFEDGVRSYTTQFDNVNFSGAPAPDGGANAWQEIYTVYDAAGNKDRRETTYDDGVTKLELFENGVRTLVYQADADDGQGGAKNWQEKLNSYDTDGQLVSAATFFDDGDTIFFNFDDGERTERVRVDGDGDDSWLLSVTTYSETGNETVNYDTVEDVPMEYFDYLDLYMN